MFNYHQVKKSYSAIIKYNIRKKLIAQSRENLVTVERTDRRTDGSCFIERCPTNTERPIKAHYN